VALDIIQTKVSAIIVVDIAALYAKMKRHALNAHQEVFFKVIPVMMAVIRDTTVIILFAPSVLPGVRHAPVLIIAVNVLLLI
jgi:hypothetical protein